MDTNFLFPHQYKKLGWLIFLPGLVLGILYLVQPEFLDLNFINVTVPAIYYDEILGEKRWFDFMQNNIFDELVCILLIIGGVLVAFSKEPEEDEYIAQLRLESLVWAIYVNYGLLLLFVLFIYGGVFLQVLAVNLFTVLIFFIIRFNWLVWKLKQSVTHAE